MAFYTFSRSMLLILLLAACSLERGASTNGHDVPDRSAAVVTGAPDVGSEYAPSPGQYLVVDLSAGPSAGSYPTRTLDALPADLLTDAAYRTDRILLRRIEAGRYVMGSPPDEIGRKENEEQHEVTISRDFYVGVFEVTQGQWLRVMGGENPSAHKGETLPVERVTWDAVRGGAGETSTPDPASFMGRLAARAGIPCDLPTEAQWEYACRAGTTSALNSGADLTDAASDPALDRLGRYRSNRGESWRAPAGSYAPNAWGLYDMHGNVYEWCRDVYRARLGSAAVLDPEGPASGPFRVERGGCWYSGADACRSASRYRLPAADAHGNLGFRLSVAIPPAGRNGEGSMSPRDEGR